ncbi:MAG: zinc ribbon domain-containing protein [Chthoniobacterales bacterium]
MSDRTCSSCGAVNTDAVVYCSQCGALLQGVHSAAGDPPPSSTVAVAKRRSQRIEADRPAAPSALSRLKGLFLYALSVAVGVVIVLALMQPKNVPPRTPALPNAKPLVQKIISAARFSPAVLSQQLINSCLDQQGPLTRDTPVKLVPMPIWESSCVELSPGKVTLFAKISLLGRPIHFSETFYPEGRAGNWSLVPEAATIGLLDLPVSFIPIVTPLLSAGVAPFSTELASLAAAQTLTIRSGFVEFTTR